MQERGLLVVHMLSSLPALTHKVRVFFNVRRVSDREVGILLSKLPWDEISLALQMQGPLRTLVMGLVRDRISADHVWRTGDTGTVEGPGRFWTAAQRIVAQRGLANLVEMHFAGK